MKAYFSLSSAALIYFAHCLFCCETNCCRADAFTEGSSPLLERQSTWFRLPRHLHAFPNAPGTTLNLFSVEESLKDLNVHSSVQILSEDPLIYVVPNLLSAQECEAYKVYVASNDSNRPMTRSNPPAVFLDIFKLWPLPVLSLLAGVPPYFRLVERSSDVRIPDILSSVIPDIGIALTAMGTFAWLLVMPLLRKVSDSSSRTSVATALNLEDDINFVRPLIKRVSAAAHCHPWQCWEAPVVTRYDPGAFFARHGDASPTRGSEWKDTGGQRVVTCICYLNTLKDGEGGETYFDKLDLAVSPQAGSALFFYPSDAQTWKADDQMTHQSLPTMKEKWIVQLFGRAERVPPPLGFLDSFEAEATHTGTM